MWATRIICGGGKVGFEKTEDQKATTEAPQRDPPLRGRRKAMSTPPIPSRLLSLVSPIIDREMDLKFDLPRNPLVAFR
jgi:hypothetical protein